MKEVREEGEQWTKAVVDKLWMPASVSVSRLSLKVFFEEKDSRTDNTDECIFSVFLVFYSFSLFYDCFLPPTIWLIVLRVFVSFSSGVYDSPSTLTNII